MMQHRQASLITRPAFSAIHNFLLDAHQRAEEMTV
jgi:hypothetical protein